MLLCLVIAWVWCFVIRFAVEYMLAVGNVFIVSLVLLLGVLLVAFVDLLVC